jgi:hypothetical protein
LVAHFIDAQFFEIHAITPCFHQSCDLRTSHLYSRLDIRSLLGHGGGSGLSIFRPPRLFGGRI